MLQRGESTQLHLLNVQYRLLIVGHHSSAGSSSSQLVVGSLVTLSSACSDHTLLKPGDVGEIVGDRGDDAGGGPFNVSVQCFFRMICTFLSVEHCDGDIAQSFLFQVKFEGETRWYDGSSLIAATPPLACCTVDQEATAAGDSGFKFEDNGQHVVFPDGPTTLLANQIVGDTKASRAAAIHRCLFDVEKSLAKSSRSELNLSSSCCATISHGPVNIFTDVLIDPDSNDTIIAYLSFIKTGENDAWSVGLLPLEKEGNKRHLLCCSSAIARAYRKGFGAPAAVMPTGATITTWVNVRERSWNISAPGEDVMTIPIPETEFPLWICFNGGSGVTITLVPDAPLPDELSAEIRVLAGISDCEEIVGDTKASRADCEAAYWTFEMSNNPCAFYYSCIAPAAVSLLLHSFKHFPGPGLAV
jgi:hypothetical protein